MRFLVPRLSVQHEDPIDTTRIELPSLLYIKQGSCICQTFFSGGLLLPYSLLVRLPLDFGTWLAKWRGDRKMTQRELARKAGLSPGYLALLERGTADPPPFKTFRRLARALEVDTDDAEVRFLAMRLEAWLAREGLLFGEEGLLEIAGRIKTASRGASRGEKIQNKRCGKPI
jgi:transcriptional regulator with XRE-family HTH domain